MEKSIFFEHVKFANSRYYSLPVYIEHYTTVLLDEFLTKKIDDRPFAVRLMAASELSQFEKFKEFKAIGDEALILLSFFEKRIEKSVNDRSYFRSIGAAGYQRAAEAACQRWLFDELAEKFNVMENLIKTARSAMKFRLID